MLVFFVGGKRGWDVLGGRSLSLFVHTHTHTSHQPPPHFLSFALSLSHSLGHANTLVTKSSAMPLPPLSQQNGAVGLQEAAQADALIMQLHADPRAHFLPGASVWCGGARARVCMCVCARAVGRCACIQVTRRLVPVRDESVWGAGLRCECVRAMSRMSVRPRRRS